MAIKGQMFKTYSEELKAEAIRLHVEEKWTYRQINEHFGIHDKQRMKKWMRKYREKGEFGLLDQWGRRQQRKSAKTGERNVKKMFGNLDAGGTTQKYRTIKEAAAEYNVRDPCKVFGVS